MRSSISIGLTAALIVACGGRTERTQTSAEPPGNTPPVDASPGDASSVDPGLDEWTMLGHDVASTYFNQHETKISTASARALVRAWELDTKAGVTSTPVISRGRVYVLTTASDSETTGGVIAIDLATGAVIWQNAAARGYSSLALDAGILYAHDAGGVVRALDAENGQELWEYKTDDSPYLAGFSSPVVTKDFVLVGGSSLEETVTRPGESATFRGFVVALNKADGRPAWKKLTVEPPSNGAAIWSTLSVDEAAGVVFAATGNNYTGVASNTSDAFLALALAGNPSFLWTQQILAGDVVTVAQSNGNPEADFGANPILFEAGGRKLVAGGNKGGDFWVLDRSDGTILKKRNLGPSSAFKGGIFNSGAWDGSHLLVAVNGAKSAEPGSESAPSGKEATLFALDPLTLDIAWERQVAGPVYSPISVAGGVGFFGKNTTLQAFDTKTGEVLFEFPTEGTIATAPAVSEGYVIFGSGMSWIQAVSGTKYYALRVP